MSDPVDISLLNRIIGPFLQSHPAIQTAIAPLQEAANSDGVANEEDNQLTEAEAGALLARMRRQTQTALGLLTRNRNALVGTLSSARDRLQEAGANDDLIAILRHAAGQDSEHEQLSAEELDHLIQGLGQEVQEMGQMTADNFLAEARQTLRQLEGIRREIPEAFLPEDPAERRRPIDLNFLKRVPPSVLFSETDQGQIIQQLLAFGNIFNPQAAEPTPEMLRNPQSLEVLLNRTANWDLTYEEIRQAYQNLPPQARAEFPSPEELMAQLRFYARLIREDFSNREAEAVREEGGDGSLGVDLRQLIARRADFQDNPFVEQLIRVAGADGVLTRMEAEHHLAEMARQNPGLQVDPTIYLAAARRLVQDLPEARPEDLRAQARPGNGATTPQAQPLSREQWLNQQVIDDLRRMSRGFSRMDLDYVERDSLFAFANAGVHAITGIGTLFIYPILSGAGFLPSYRDLRREESQGGDTERGNAIQALERLLTRPDREFRAWLESRPAGRRQVNVPNALEYLRTYEERYERRVQSLLTHRIGPEDLRRYLADYRSGDAARRERIPAQHRDYLRFRSLHREDPEVTEENVRAYLFQIGVENPRNNHRHYDLLVSPLLQADRLWRIRNITDATRSEEAWFALANELREGVWATGEVATVLDHINNPDFARAILHGLRLQSTRPEMRSRARVAYQDSIGADITDDQGNVVEEGNGEFALWPPDWFRNFSDENASYAVNDIILLVATWRAGGYLFRGATKLISTAGRPLGRAAMSLLGLGALRLAGGTGTRVLGDIGMAEGPGMVSRWLARMIGRRLQVARDHLIALEAARAAGQTVTGAEMTVAREAVTNASRVHEILTAPIRSSLPGRAVKAAADRVLNPEAWSGRILTRMGNWTSRAGRWVAQTAETRGGQYAVNTLAVILWILSRSARLTGRFLKWATYDGIVTMGIAQYLYEAAPRHTNEPLVHDREYDLQLPERPEPRRPRRRRESPTLPPPEGPRVVDPTPEPAQDAGPAPSRSPDNPEAVRLAQGIVEAGE